MGSASSALLETGGAFAPSPSVDSLAPSSMLGTECAERFQHVVGTGGGRDGEQSGQPDGWLIDQGATVCICRVKTAARVRKSVHSQECSVQIEASSPACIAGEVPVLIRHLSIMLLTSRELPSSAFYAALDWRRCPYPLPAGRTSGAPNRRLTDCPRKRYPSDYRCAG